MTVVTSTGTPLNTTNWQVLNISSGYGASGGPTSFGNSDYASRSGGPSFALQGQGFKYQPSDFPAPVSMVLVDGLINYLSFVLESYKSTFNGLTHYSPIRFFTIKEISISVQDFLEARTTGLAARILTGDDEIYGSNYADRIDTLAGNDKVYGEGGDDRLQGGTGNDYLDGSVGSDVLIGGKGADEMHGSIYTSNIYSGDDRFFVDNSKDRVFELVGDGRDVVNTSVSFTLAADQEIEVLRANGAALGAHLVLVGNEFNNRISGHDGSDTLLGLAGNDTLIGGLSWDVLKGGAGADLFIFNTAPGAASVDLIVDFQGGVDHIGLDNAIFTAIAGTGLLTATQFRANVNGHARDADDRIIYETDTGKLFYDSNGNATGGRVQIAVLNDHPALTATDFLIY